jgi:hypothetical protein
VVSIEGYVDVDPLDSALLCATVQQPISVGMDGSALDFQLYTGVSISDSLAWLELQIVVRKCCLLDCCDMIRESMTVTALVIRTTLIMLF